jgi:hypothetical protein
VQFRRGYQKETCFTSNSLDVESEARWRSFMGKTLVKHIFTESIVQKTRGRTDTGRGPVRNLF